MAGTITQAPHPRHRHLMVCRGAPEETAAAALDVLRGRPAEACLWIGDHGPPGAAVAVAPQAARRHLGATYEVVVLDLHGGVDPDLLGQAQGLVIGGGALVLRAPRGPLRLGDALRGRLAVPPFPPEAVGDRMQRHIDGRLSAYAARHVTAPRALPTGPHPIEGTPEQGAVVEALVDAWSARSPGLTVLTASRGRGKSSALGLAALGLAARRPASRVIVSAIDRRAAAEVLRFAGDAPLRFVPLSALLDEPAPPDLLILDEAARIGVPLLQHIVRTFPSAHLAFATTTHGYEGTGRGFVLKFLHWLEAQASPRRPLRRLTLTSPIRWAAGDPVERLVHEALLLDASPAPAEALRGQPRHVALDRDALLEDPALLGDFFGLLVHAHYRTTPGDLLRLLDAPNLRLHALLRGGRVAAASFVALEGQLDAPTIEGVYQGTHTLRGQALPEVLVGRGGWRAAGRLSLVRSVRIAVHPACRRQGLGSMLAEGVHQSLSPDLFGTLFGATPALLAFRRQMGYRLVQLGVAAGPSTGVPSAVMLKPCTPAAAALVDEMRRALARDLPDQLELMQAGGHVRLRPDLVHAALAGLPPEAPLTAEQRDEIMASVVHGRRPLESGARAARAFVRAYPTKLDELSLLDRALIQSRLLEGRGWEATRKASNLQTVRAAMRAHRRALGALYEICRPP